jgi:hypothetical protein
MKEDARSSQERLVFVCLVAMLKPQWSEQSKNAGQIYSFLTDGAEDEKKLPSYPFFALRSP